MNLEESLRKTLIESAGVTALVQSRIYPVIALEDTVFPCIVYSTPTSRPDDATYTLDGPAMWRTRIVLSALGRTWLEAHAVADVIYVALGPYQGQRQLGNNLPIEALHFEDLEDRDRDPDSGIYRFDRTIEVLQTQLAP